MPKGQPDQTIGLFLILVIFQRPCQYTLMDDIVYSHAGGG